MVISRQWSSVQRGGKEEMSIAAMLFRITAWRFAVGQWLRVSAMHLQGSSVTCYLAENMEPFDQVYFAYVKEWYARDLCRSLGRIRFQAGALCGLPRGIITFSFPPNLVNLQESSSVHGVAWVGPVCRGGDSQWGVGCRGLGQCQGAGMKRANCLQERDFEGRSRGTNINVCALLKSLVP
jgi:hypothetical protein